VKELVDLKLQHLPLCVTSRPEINIQIVLESLSSFQISLHDEVGQKKDIRDYIRSIIDTDPMMRRWLTEDKLLVIDTLSRRADGM
jgi:hypothetical protein